MTIFITYEYMYTYIYIYICSYLYTHTQVTYTFQIICKQKGSINFLKNPLNMEVDLTLPN